MMIELHYPQMGFTEIEVHKQPEVAAHYRVFAAPVALVILDGKEAFRYVRTLGLQEIKQQLDWVYPMLFH